MEEAYGSVSMASLLVNMEQIDYQLASTPAVLFRNCKALVKKSFAKSFSSTNLEPC
jgi:hypothetical protein